METLVQDTAQYLLTWWFPEEVFGMNASKSIVSAAVIPNSSAFDTLYKVFWFGVILSQPEGQNFPSP